MKVVDHRDDLRQAIAAWRAAGERIAFVPTMGNLHAGHMALVQRARELADRVVASVFVNPTQFGPNEDYDSYPRTFEADRDQLLAAHCDLLYVPAIDDIYPQGRQHSTTVQVHDLTDDLCGASRPGHFRGVTTVVTKLLNLVQPQVAVFGKKDYQQWRVIERCVADLCMPIDIVGAETTRETDGLAMSSRNGYLTPDERAKAPTVYAVLQRAKQALRDEPGGWQNHAHEASETLRQAGFEPEYMELRQQIDLLVPAQPEGNLVILCAARLGKARLIDNIELILPSVR